MRVYLMRHGQPVSSMEDPEQPLSDLGKKDVEKIAEFLHRTGVEIDQALHSGKARAKQTAAIMASRLNSRLELQESPCLGPLDNVTRIANQIKEAKKDQLIAGHMPHLGKLVSLLVVGDPLVPVVNFQQGGVVCLEKDEKERWSIIWVLVPDIL
ncbi:MAG: phosphohistidine phosphatase SixA [Deltaproteobacteria bacterium]|nr:phosphohistidine phosphatase SixA [Deltaproteobacteria bacterium]